MTAPEDAGFSAERLERIRPVMQGYVDDGRSVPGFLTVVARRGEKSFILKRSVCGI